MTLASDDPRHGTAGGYSNQGCRCKRCRTAAVNAHRQWRLRRRRGIAPRALVPAGPERERDERRWNGRLAAEYGATVTFENEAGETLVLARRGPPSVALRAMCATARAVDDSFRVVSYSTPETVRSDLAHARPANARLPEWGALGAADCYDELHPRLRGATPASERFWRARDAQAG